MRVVKVSLYEQVYTPRMLTSPLRRVKSKVQEKYPDVNFVALAGIVFWYLALFPGRLSYDSAEAIRLIQVGKSTDMWSAPYFNFLRLTTFGGKTLFLSSAISISFLFFAIKHLISQLPLKKKTSRLTLSCISLSPLFGAFGVTVSHDVFQAAGIIMLIFIELKKKNSLIFFSKDFYHVILAFICLIMTHGGIAIILSYLVLNLIRRNFRLLLHVSPAFILIFSIFSVDVKKHDDLQYIQVIADMKCIAQHPDADLSEADWKILSKIAPIREWKNQVSCAMVDYLTGALPSMNERAISSVELIRTFLRIVSHNPQIAVYQHIMRSTVALPPPFFMPPQNQIEWGYKKPIGLNSNSELQQGIELLHSSIDEPSVKKQFSIFKPLEYIALLNVFLINQASWFWSWGGFWLWFIIICWQKLYKGNKLRDIYISIYPIIALHVFLFIFSPHSDGRYVMGTILVGNISALILIIDKLSQNKN